MFQPLLPISYARKSSAGATKGVVYTKSWVVSLLLDLAGYLPETDLVDRLAVEPAAGEGAFLATMARRLVLSCRRQGRPLADCAPSLLAYELDEGSAAASRREVVVALKGMGVLVPEAESLASAWVRVGDYLIDAPRLGSAEFVIGNPPYVRLEEIPSDTARLYRAAYPTMKGRADLYIAFFEAALRQLGEGGVCAFICADRWMLNQYGAELRRFVTEGFAVEYVIEMHEADPFDDEVSAYPAITVIRRAKQAKAVVASIASAVEAAGGPLLDLAGPGDVGAIKGPGTRSAVVESWFAGADPWPCGSPARLALIRRLEEHFGPLESQSTGTKVGIGVATGLDKLFITKDPTLVEPSRLLPLAMAQDTISGHLHWSGHYLINPWQRDGLVDLQEYPRLRAYFHRHRESIARRNTAQKNPGGWFRTIDRVSLDLTGERKLLIPDIKDVFNPVHEAGCLYPHHNLYYICSTAWDLEVLGGLLLSSLAQLFIEAYGVRMRGGYLRFQAQYLRRIRVPHADSMTASQVEGLKRAFRERDRYRATDLALEIYRVDRSELEHAHRG